MPDYAVVRDGLIEAIRSEPYPISTPMQSPDGTVTLPLVRDGEPVDPHKQVIEGTEYVITDTHVIERPKARDLTWVERTEIARERRAANYPPIGDQLDAILKALEVVNQHWPLPHETIRAIAEWRSVKRHIPLPPK